MFGVDPFKPTAFDGFVVYKHRNVKKQLALISTMLDISGAEKLWLALKKKCIDNCLSDVLIGGYSLRIDCEYTFKKNSFS